MAAVAIWSVFGSAVGSFLNVVIHRVPAGRSVVSPGSACGACGHEIRWYDNVPMLSWLILRGRCRDCAVPISVRYPLIELAGAVFFGVVAWRFLPAFGMTPEDVADWVVLAAFQFLAASSIALAAIDLATRRLPNAIVGPTALVGLAAFVVTGILTGQWMPLLGAALGAFAYGALYAIPAFVKPGAMGMGDVKLAAVLGGFLGYLGIQYWIVGVIIGALIAGIIGAALLVSGRRGATVALGPWLLVGAWIGILAAPAITTGYLSLFGIH